MKKSELVQMIREEIQNIVREADSPAAIEAKKKGWTSIGWGRWADKSGMIVAKTVNGKLTPIKADQQVSNYTRNPVSKKPEPNPHGGSPAEPGDSYALNRMRFYGESSTTMQHAGISPKMVRDAKPRDDREVDKLRNAMWKIGEASKSKGTHAQRVKFMKDAGTKAFDTWSKTIKKHTGASKHPNAYSV